MEKKIAIITGASSGIGKAGAIRFAKEGYNLVIAARRRNKLEEVAELCRAEGAEVLVVQGDMSNPEDVKNVFAKALEKFGTIDFVWSNQGVLTVPTVFEELTVDQFYTVSENNFKSTFLMLTEATNVFRKLEKPGNVVCTGSFITHRRRKADLERAKNIGIAQYNLEQQEKVQILSYLLSNYNDGRRKNFFCVAVNLLELSEIQEAIKQIQSNHELPALPFKAQCLYVVDVFQKIAGRRNIKLKLAKRKPFTDSRL